MGNTYADRQKDNQSEEDLFYSSNKIGYLTGHNAMITSQSKARSLAKGAKPGRALILKLIQLDPCDICLPELFLKRSPVLGIRIPKHLVSLDEKYLRQCLELIHMNASKGAPCALSVNMGSLGMDSMSDYVTVSRRNSLEGDKYVIDYPMDVQRRDLVRSPVDETCEGIVGSIMGSNSMMRILSSPLFQRLGILDHDAGLGGASLFENNRGISCDYQGCPSGLTCSPFNKPGKENLTLRNQRYSSDSVQMSPISRSSGLSVSVDQSSPSFSLSDSQGMLQCTWNCGIPHFTFSLDDHKGLYVASAGKVEVSNDKVLDYVYSFHFKASDKKNSDIFDDMSNLIGKMKVSTSFSLCSSNSKVMETEFVLVGVNENHAREMYSLTPSSKRSRKLSKVLDVFKSGNSNKQRNPSIFDGFSTIPENSSAEKVLEVSSKINQQYRPNLSDNDFLPTLEMAAVVVKNHMQDEDNHKEEAAGWGLKFLKRARNKQKVTSANVSTSPERCRKSTCNCSTDMDIIVPAGIHGGPKISNGGPTSLIERWRLGGRCDCGGWDIGCPLKVLRAKPRGEEGSPSSEAPEDCKSFDFFPEGSKLGGPTLKMVNIHENLYFISFQSSFLSVLQCFSIAVAIVHSQSPTLRPKRVKN